MYVINFIILCYIIIVNENLKLLMQDNKKFKLVSVLLSGPFDKVFSYKINISSYEVGKIIIAPFRNQKLLGIILDEDPDLIDDEKVKEVDCSIKLPPLSKIYIEFINFFGKWNCIKRGLVLKQIFNPHDKNSIKKVEDLKIYDFYKMPEIKTCSQISLNDNQKTVSKKIIKNFTQKKSKTFLLHGIAGSGKTETYFEAINFCIKNKKQVLILLPEIGLTSEWENRFEKRFGIVPDKWHSGIKKSVKKRIWARTILKKDLIIVGARSALFLPLSNLGLIIIDEEHDSSFKQEEGQRYHARDMSIYLSSKAGVPAILASATPSIESLHNVFNKKYVHLSLPSRATGAQMPDVQIIDMKDNQPLSGNWISEPMVNELKRRYDNKEQAMIFLNRRGYSNLTICRTCGHRMSCKNCNSWLIEHRKTNKYLCHHCGYKKPLSDKCENCSSHDLVSCGPGIEKISDEIKNIFPNSIIENLSSDTFSNLENFNSIIKNIIDGKVNFIIGTQILAKGYDFPKLNYVGIIDGDVGVYGGDLRASEKCFQLLKQVSGRAGRHLKNKKGLVQIQTYNPQNPILKTIKDMDENKFYLEEISYRKDAAMPPFSRLISIIISSKSENILHDVCYNLLEKFPRYKDIKILGPAPAPLSFLRGRYRNRFLIKSPKNTFSQDIVKNWIENTKIPKQIRISIDVDPYTFS